MTACSAFELLAEVRRLGGRLEAKPPDILGVDLPASEMPRLAPMLRQRKYDLLMLLRRPTEVCPASHPRYWWQDRVGVWHCGRCEPDPAGRRFRGIELPTLGNRAVTLTPPVSELPAIGEWASTPVGVGEVVLYREDGAEALVRLFRGQRLAWLDSRRLLPESSWRHSSDSACGIHLEVQKFHNVNWARRSQIAVTKVVRNAARRHIAANQGRLEAE